MTYREYDISIEIGLLEDGTRSSYTWYVVNDEAGTYQESLSSVEEAKQYVDWLMDGPDGSTWSFAPLAGAGQL